MAARDLERTPLLDDEFRVVLPAGHPLTRRRRPLRLEDLSAEPWIGGARSSPWLPDRPARLRAGRVRAGRGLCLRRLHRRPGARRRRTRRVHDPGPGRRPPPAGVEVRALRSGAPTRRIAVARPRDGYNGPAVRAMLESLQTAAAGLR
jgi:DNA-binding transcriptional LysR family regulator